MLKVHAGVFSERIVHVLSGFSVPQCYVFKHHNDSIFFLFYDELAVLDKLSLRRTMKDGGSLIA